MQASTEDLKRNIKLLPPIQASQFTNACLVYVNLMLSNRGYGIWAVICPAMPFLVSGILQIPSGYLADQIGRKKCLLAGLVLAATGYGLYMMTDMFRLAPYVAAPMIGLAWSSMEGADAALATDSCIALAAQSCGDTVTADGVPPGLWVPRYQRYEGKTARYIALGMGVGSTMGATCAAFFGIQAAFAVQIAFYLAGATMALFLVEPEVQRERLPMHAHFKEFRAILRGFRKNRPLVAVAGLRSSLGSSSIPISKVAMVFYASTHLPAQVAGYWWAACLSSGWLIGKFKLVQSLSARKEAQRVLTVVIGIIGLAYVVIGRGPSVFGLAATTLLFVIMPVYKPILATKMSTMVRSAERAMINSVQRTMQMITVFALGVLLALASELLPLGSASAIVGLLNVGVAGVCLIVMRRSESRSSQA